jgi:lipoyl(octanoyl) transferase
VREKVAIINLGRTAYRDIWELQRKIFTLRAEAKISDVLILNEHNHVYTIGKTGCDDHLLACEDELHENNVEVYHIDRGGDITYHGPGQLVGYPILDLTNHYLDIHRYLRDLEEVIIRTLREHRIDAHRDKDFTGVWVGNEKIAAIGVKVSRWITMHGFALNIATDLNYFDRIIPCGIFHRGITSMEKVSGKVIPADDVATSIIRNYSEVFDCDIVHYTKDEFVQYLSTLTDEKVECL